MNEAQYQRVLAACHSQRATKDIEIVQEEYGVYYDQTKWASYGCACALGCLLLEEQPPAHNEFSGGLLETYEAAAKLLDTTDHEIESFVAGFDEGKLSGKYADCIDWFTAGERMAVELGLVPPLDEPIPYALVDVVA